MAEQFGGRYNIDTRTRSAEFDQGLRSHMLKVYNYMASGLLLTGIVALVFANMIESNPALAQTLYGSPLRWVVALSPLAIIMVMSFGLNKLNITALQGCFWGFATLMGVSLASIFLVYTSASIAQMFFITAIAFGSLSLWGYTTKKDISGWGSFLYMGVIGIFVAMLVNMFLGSPMIQFVVSVIGVLVFAGLTAYDTQRIKHMYFEGYGHEAMAKLSIMGALSLYINFINMFLFLLSLFGNRE